MPNINELKVDYAKAHGLIVRTSPSKTNISKELYKLNVKTLFLAAISLREDKIENANEHEAFFYYLITQGAPCEILFCVALQTDSKILSLDKLCTNWKSTIHHALQFAVIEFLTDLCGIGKSVWKNIILRLLQLGANPNHSDKTFSDIKNAYLKSELHVDCDTPLQMLLSFKTFDKNSYELSVACFNSCKEKMESREFIFALMKAVYDPVDYPSDYFRFQSYAHRQLEPLLEDFRFKCIDENFPEHLKSYIEAHHSTFICARVRTDFHSIGYIMNRYKIYPFETIFKNLINLRIRPLISLKQFQFFEERFSQPLSDYIQKNIDDLFSKCLFHTIYQDPESLKYIVHKYNVLPNSSEQIHANRQFFSELNPIYEERIRLIMRFKETHKFSLDEIFKLPDKDISAYDRYYWICAIAKHRKNDETLDETTRNFLKTIPKLRDDGIDSTMEMKPSHHARPSFVTYIGHARFWGGRSVFWMLFL